MCFIKRTDPRKHIPLLRELSAVYPRKASLGPNKICGRGTVCLETMWSEYITGVSVVILELRTRYSFILC